MLCHSRTNICQDKADCGICVDAEDAQGLTEAIIQLYNDRNRAETLGRNGRDYLVLSCDRKTITAQYEELFLSVTEVK